MRDSSFVASAHRNRLTGLLGGLLLLVWLVLVVRYQYNLLNYLQYPDESETIVTAKMMAAIPRYRSYAGGMEGGPDNPLGPRALYLYRDGRDTFFRLHGTTEPETIGTAVSSGCIRLFNQDIIDLFDRVPVGTHVTVMQG